MLLERLAQLYTTLSKSHRRLADYLAANYREAAFMTSTQLASHTQVDEATVTRFAQHLGYKGYPELVDELRGLVQAELAPREQQEAANANSAISAALHALSDRTLRLDQQLDAAAVERALQMISDAAYIIILAQGISAPLAGLLAALLNTAGYAAGAVNGDPFLFAAAAANSVPGELVIGMSFGEESPEVALALSFARQQGAGTLALAGSPTNSAVQAAELALAWLGEESQPACTAAQAAVLLAAIVSSLPQRSAEAKERRQRLAQAVEAILPRRRR